MNNEIDLDKLLKDFNEWNRNLQKKMDDNRVKNEETKKKLIESRMRLLELLDDKTNYGGCTSGPIIEPKESPKTDREH